jgi:hypothetical protein
MEDQSNMKQTAVELYEIEIDLLIEKYESKEISKREFITMKHNIFYQAKEMEKDQAKKIWDTSQENMHRQFSSSTYKPITFDQWYSNRNK